MYTTGGIIMRVKSIHTADLLVYSYTRNLGMIMATARSVRTMRSKLRAHLSVCSAVDLSVVRGRAGWRLVGAEQSHVFQGIFTDVRKRAAVGRVFTILERLTDEGGVPDIFFALHHFLEHLEAAPPEREVIFRLETLVVAYILSRLGYVDRSAGEGLVRHMRGEGVSGESIHALTAQLRQALASL